MKHVALVSVVVGGLSLALGAQGSSDVVKAAADTMGVATLQSIQYSGAGSAFLVGQAASPGGPWPRFELAKYVASVDYAAPAMREETVRRDVEYPPRGGGAGPFNPATGQDTSDGVHPNAAGSVKIAAKWFNALASLTSLF